VVNAKIGTEGVKRVGSTWADGQKVAATWYRSC